MGQNSMPLHFCVVFEAELIFMRPTVEKKFSIFFIHFMYCVYEEALATWNHLPASCENEEGRKSHKLRRFIHTSLHLCDVYMLFYCIVLMCKDANGPFLQVHTGYKAVSCWTRVLLSTMLFQHWMLLVLASAQN